MGGKETKQRRLVGGGAGQQRIRSGGGNERRRASDSRRADDDELKAELIQHRRRSVSHSVAVLCEDKVMLVGGIKFGRYGKLTSAILARALGLNGTFTAVTCQVENIQQNNDTLAATLSIT